MNGGPVWAGGERLRGQKRVCNMKTAILTRACRAKEGGIELCYKCSLPTTCSISNKEIHYKVRWEHRDRKEKKRKIFLPRAPPPIQGAATDTKNPFFHCSRTATPKHMTYSRAPLSFLPGIFGEMGGGERERGESGNRLTRRDSLHGEGGETWGYLVPSVNSVR